MLKNISNSTIETLGFLHFDASKGCTAEVLNAALLDLCSVDVIQAIESSHKALHIRCTIEPKLDVRKAVHGTVLLNPSHSQSWIATMATERVPRSPVWNEPIDSVSLEIAHAQEKDDATLYYETTSFEKLCEHVRSASLNPVVKTIMFKALDELVNAYKSVGVVEIESEYAETILSSIATFASLIHFINPLGVSANKIPVSIPTKAISRLEKQLEDEQPVLYSLLENIPSFENAWPGAYCDILGLALLKSVVSSFGLRADGVLLKTATGFSRALHSHEPLRCYVHYVEPNQIETRAIEGVQCTPKLQRLNKVEALVNNVSTLPGFINKLTVAGAQQITTTHAIVDCVYPKTKLSLVTSTSSLDLIITLLFIDGEAVDVCSYPVEQRKLRQRIVSVSFGRGQSMQYCNVIEWLLGDSIVRAEPVESDLAKLMATTGYSREALRKDILEHYKHAPM